MLRLCRVTATSAQLEATRQTQTSISKAIEKGATYDQKSYNLKEAPDEVTQIRTP